MLQYGGRDLPLLSQMSMIMLNDGYFFTYLSTLVDVNVYLLTT